MTNNESGSGLTRLTEEPKDCEFLYNLDSVVTNYNITDAYEYIENSILEQRNFIGDSYYVVNENITENAGRTIFGPEHTYKFKVRVYKCEKE
jgi:hypothetical protein